MPHAQSTVWAWPISTYKDGTWMGGRPLQQVHSGKALSTQLESCIDGNDKHFHGLNDDSLENECDEMRDGLEPYKGLEFKSLDEAQIFYESYARRSRFRIRVDSTQTSVKTGAMYSCTYVCFQAGPSNLVKDGVVIGKKRSRYESTEGCNARMVVTLSKQGKWVVTSSVKEHNHNLVEQSMVGDIQSYRHMDEGQKDFCRTIPVARISPKGIMGTMAGVAGGVDTVPFTEHDMRNNVFHGIMKGTDRGDAQTTINLLTKMKEENPSFFYKFQLDDEKRLTNIFWVDAKSRIDYHHFGDVISFGIIYNTNIHEKPFAPFVGVNHHNQTILFGCGLLQDESRESFTFLFESWLEAMCNRPPAAIVTSPDPEILEAAAKVFPKARHRLCMWHIMKKFPLMLSKHLPSAFRDQLKTCIHKSKTIKEFEITWEVVLKKFGMSSNGWLQSLYQIRRQWVPAYLRDTFFAEMSTTIRIRNLKSFFDLNAKTTLLDFVKRYTRVVNDQCRQENVADHESKYKPFPLIFHSSLEMEAAKIYTRTAFLKFQRELKKSKNYKAEMKRQVGVDFFFAISKCENANKAYTVSFNSFEKKCTCTCHHFEYSGIICRHILNILDRHDVKELSPHYVLKRWTKSARNGDVFDENGIKMRSDCNESLTLRYSQFCYRMNQLAERATSSMALFNMVMEELDEIEKKIDAFSSGAQNADCDATEKMTDPTILLSCGFRGNVIVHDPVLASTKFKKSSIGIEGCKKLPRQCKSCLRYGACHDSRNCPLRRSDLGTRSTGDENDESGSEIESWIEEAKPRQCKTCYQYGVNHDSRNCPSKRNYVYTRSIDDKRVESSPEINSVTDISKKQPRQCKSCFQYGAKHDSRNCPIKRNDTGTCESSYATNLTRCINYCQRLDSNV